MSSLHNITTDFLSSPDLKSCYNSVSFGLVVAFNYYLQNQTCQLFYNYSSIYTVYDNDTLSQMCILQLPDSQKAGIISCSMSSSIWDPRGITVAGLENELDSPFAVVFSTDYSFLFVTDTHHDRILQYNMDSSSYTVIYDSNDIDNPVVSPLAIAITNNGSELIVANYLYRVISRWSLIENKSSLVMFFRIGGPTGLAIDKDDNIYISNSLSPEVIRFAPTDTVYSFSEGWLLEQVLGAKHMTIVNNSIYIAESAQCRVIKVSLMDNNYTQVVVAGNGLIGSTSSRLRFPWGVAVDPTEGHVFVSDTANHRIQLWLVNSTEGITVAGISARPGVGPDQLYRPHGLTLGPDGSLFVADTNNGRIQKFQRYCLV